MTISHDANSANGSRVYFGWKIVVAGFFLTMFGYATIPTTVGLFVLPVTTELGFSIGDFILWLSIQSLVAMVVLFFASSRINEKTLKPLMLIGAICGVIGFVGFSQATELWQFYVFALFLGVTFALVPSTPCQVLINNWFGPKKRGVALGWVFGGASIGATVLTLVLNAVVMSAGWRAAYLFDAALVACCVPLILIFCVWSPSKKGLTRIGDENVQSDKMLADKPGILFRDAKKRVSTWLMLATGALATICSATMITNTQPYLEMSGFDTAVAATICSVMFGLLFFGQIIVGMFCDKFRLQYSAVVVALIFAAGFAAEAFVPIAPGLVIIVVIGYALGACSINIISPLLVNFMFGEKDLPAIVGYVNIFIAFGGAVGNAIMGQLLNATGSYALVFGTCAAILLFTAVLRGIFTSKKYEFIAPSNDQ